MFELTLTTQAFDDDGREPHRRVLSTHPYRSLALAAHARTRADLSRLLGPHGPVTNHSGMAQTSWEAPDHQQSTIWLEILMPD